MRPHPDVPMPARIARLPRNHVGYPVPWFVAHIDGKPDFRIADEEKRYRAHKLDLCWICGQHLGSNVAFVIGPMCAVNRISGEPPSHRDCAVYAATACPFLTVPGMRRRESGKPADMVKAAGEMNERNPGVALVWVTRSFKVRLAPMGNKGPLWHLGIPRETLWYREGRPATRAEVVASIEDALPTFEAACDRDADPYASRQILARDIAAAMQLVPA